MIVEAALDRPKRDRVNDEPRLEAGLDHKKPTNFTEH